MNCGPVAKTATVLNSNGISWKRRWNWSMPLILHPGTTFTTGMPCVATVRFFFFSIHHCYQVCMVESLRYIDTIYSFSFFFFRYVFSSLFFNTLLLASMYGGIIKMTHSFSLFFFRYLQLRYPVPQSRGEIAGEILWSRSQRWFSQWCQWGRCCGREFTTNVHLERVVRERGCRCRSKRIDEMVVLREWFWEQMFQPRGSNGVEWIFCEM